jgi:hypothetical protein
MAYIGRTTDGFGVRQRFVFTPDAGTTAISGDDDSGATLTFSDSVYMDVFLNGVLLKPGTDYNTNTANTIAGLTATVANDEVTVLVYDIFTTADMVSATSGGTFSGNVTMGGTLAVTGASTLTGNVALGGTLDMNGAELILDADADTSIHSSTDDQIDIKVGNVDKVILTGNGDISLGGNTPNTYSGYTALTIGGSASTTGSTIDFEDSDGNRDAQIYANGNYIYLSGKDVMVETGDLIFGASGKGINLGVTSNTDSNTLDDYEEGTFTFGTNANLTLQSSSNVGKYTKIGRVVHIQAALDVSSVSGSNHVFFSSLPFTNGSHGSSTLNGWGIGNVSVYNVNFDDDANYHYAVIDAGSTAAYIYASKDNANWDILTNAELVSSSEIGMNLTYMVD